MNYTKYIVGQGDTLTGIAFSQLGTDDVSGVISFNNLRYPYISDDPIDQYAHEKGQLQLQSSLIAGSSQCTFGNSSGITVQNLDTVYFEEITTGKHESVVVLSQQKNSNGTITVSFQSKTVNSYSIAVVVTVFSNQENVITKVLKTGDTLYLPISNVQTSFTANAQSDIYGTDIQLDNSGLIIRGSNDWSTVSGVSNVSQAVALRWRTPYGEHPFHPKYGNRMFELVGEESESYYWMLAETFATQCALSDPRVDSINNMQLTKQNDQIFITADAIPSNSNSSFTVSTLTGGE